METNKSPPPQENFAHSILLEQSSSTKFCKGCHVVLSYLESDHAKNWKKGIFHNTIPITFDRMFEIQR